LVPGREGQQIPSGNDSKKNKDVWPKSKKWLFGAGLLAEVGVVAVDPVLAGWIEEVEVYGVFEGEGFVWEIGRDAEEFAGTEDDFAGTGLVKDETEATGEKDGDLFVGVAVERHVGALGEGDAGDHDVGADDELAAEERGHGLDGDAGPTGVDRRGGHGGSAKCKCDV
jgi:hypothetical protein